MGTTIGCTVIGLIARLLATAILPGRQGSTRITTLFGIPGGVRLGARCHRIVSLPGLTRRRAAA